MMILKNNSIRIVCCLITFLGFGLVVVNGERIFDEVQFTKELCSELGYDNNEFDVCGMIEFCHGKDNVDGYKRRNTKHNVHHRRRHLRNNNNNNDNRRNIQGYEDYEQFENEIEQVQEEYGEENEEDLVDDYGDESEYEEEEEEEYYDEEGGGGGGGEEWYGDDMEDISSMGMDDLNDNMYGDYGDEYDDFDEDEDYGNDFPGEDEEEGSSSTKNSKGQQNGSSRRHEGIAVYGWRTSGSVACTWPGPIIRLDRGVKHGLFVKGVDGEITNMHMHGLHIPGHGNGDDISRQIEGKDTTVIYNVTIPQSHMGGTFWYHSHYHGTANKHIMGGAFGMVIVDDGDYGDVGTNDAGVLKFLKNDKILVVDNKEGSNDRWIGNGMVGRGQPDDFIMNDDEWYRLRIMMVNMNMHRSGGLIRFPSSQYCTVRSIAHDGIFKFQVPSLESKEEYWLSGAGRLDVAIKCTGLDDGTATPGYISIDGSNVASIKTTKSTASVAEDPNNDNIQPSPFEQGNKQWSSKRPEYLQDLRNVENIDNHWKIRVETTTINSQQWLPIDNNDALCDDMGNDFEYGSTQEWDISGSASHPLHIHMYPVQIMNDACGSQYHEIGEYYDTVVAVRPSDVPYRKHCKVRTKLVDVAGKTVLHCHIIRHEDMGAMGFFNVVNGPTQPNEPRVQSCSSSSAGEGEEQCDVPIKSSHCRR